MIRGKVFYFETGKPCCVLVYSVLTVKFCQPSHEFTFGVGMNFISYPFVLTPLVYKIFFG
jgi:hypothetical protein